ncbi:class I adenylate-forming enzyme family protein [Amycolatopsis sp. H20-H5]|uniref:class I adenylate-forming enzyme family protein n=1 Tax=Amycolatopsis sp. H20-H5 TaxID=3046309 RepID=UPI002DBC034B|nr:class I adenylate-forming enzyme family protein [Amycolatopsis sp. H20-H5]MEC3980745.1 class I adenylate-forming enzyme family protein [Amycolatopsis sp. H20-H5]
MKCHPADRAGEYRSNRWWSTETIDGLARARVTDDPEGTALIDPPNTAGLLGSDPVRWSWRDLDEHVDALAALLLGRGVRAGDVVAVQLPNCSALVQAFLAIVRIGAIVTPFPVSYREHEMGPMCRRTGAVAVLTAGRLGERALAEAAQRIRTEALTVRFVLSRGENEPDGGAAWPDRPATAAEKSLVDEHVAGLDVDVNDCVTICWTSGTEAEPKAVPRCHGDWLAMAGACRQAARLGQDDVLLSPFPMTNMAGIAGMFLPWLLGGGVFVPHHPFDLPVFLEQLATQRVTYTVAPPVLLTMLLRNEKILSGVDISALRQIGSGSAPLSPWLVRTWAERHGIDLINFFGSNEGIALLSDPVDIPDPEHRASYFPHYASDVRWSTPVAGWTSVRLHDPVTGGRVTGPGRPGELRIAGPTVFAGYLTESTSAPLDRRAFDEDGYFRTGDVFEIAGERQEYLRYVDRAKDLVIRGGMNISPAEIEGLLAEHPDVAEVGVIGVPDEVLGERVCAIVVAGDRRPTLDELTGFLRERRVASFKLPERLEFAEALPRNPVGKILKRKLREQLEA